MCTDGLHNVATHVALNQGWCRRLKKGDKQIWFRLLRAAGK